MYRVYTITTRFVYTRLHNPNLKANNALKECPQSLDDHANGELPPTQRKE